MHYDNDRLILPKLPIKIFQSSLWIVNSLIIRSLCIYIRRYIRKLRKDINLTYMEWPTISEWQVLLNLILSEVLDVDYSWVDRSDGTQKQDKNTLQSQTCTCMCSHSFVIIYIRDTEQQDNNKHKQRCTDSFHRASMHV